ncbi:MAG: 30S ribosome-binding factor RbfA [Gammaproteobacteria bacterium]|nr:30S ribosome-binding factor RbfA [Gammaproteobacteria bacterium]
MAREFSRGRRVGEQIQRELSKIIPREIKDPRLGMVTISAVDVARNLSIAKVYVTLMDRNTPEEIKTSIKILNGAAGFLRHEYGRCVSLKHIPELRFYHDISIARAAHLSALIDSAVSADSADKTTKSGEEQ